MQEATGLRTHGQQPPRHCPKGWFCSRVNSLAVPLRRVLGKFALLPKRDKDCFVRWGQLS